MSAQPRLRGLVLFALVASAAIIAACATPATTRTIAPSQAVASDSECDLGAYRSPDGDDVVALMNWNEGFNYTFVDGRMGNTAHPKSRVSCVDGAVLVTQPDGTLERWPQVPLRMTPTRFESDGTTLAGLLVEPANPSEKPPLVVILHGAGDEPWTTGRVHFPFTLAGQGIATFVFDKRGTGESGGEFTMNFHRLAEDVVAASAEARRMAEGRFDRFGFYGFSQAAWVAPLATKDAGADFIAIGYGAVYSPLEEDAEEVFDDLRAQGYGEDVIAKARLVTEATRAIRASHFTSGYEQLARVKEAYGDEPWFSEIEGEFTGGFLRASEAELRSRAGQNELEIPWEHDAMAVLRSLSIPQLWVLAGEDRSTPSPLTLERLATLQDEGKPIQVALFPDTDHGIFKFVEQPDGTRRYTRAAEGFFRLLGDWIQGCLSPPYGDAIFYPPLGEAEGPTSAACRPS